MISQPRPEQLPPAVLRPLLVAARERWPGLALDEAAFAAVLVDRRPEGAAPGTSWLAELHASDLYLVGACLAGEARALTFLSELAMPIAAEVAARHGGGDLGRMLLAALLVAEPGKRPKLGQYGGRGALGGFLRVCATRLALDEHGGGARARLVPVDEVGLAAQAFSAPADEELTRFREIYRPAFAEAVREALAGLPARERNLLRMHYVERLPCARIAALYNVHTATAWRWIDRTHKDLRGDILRRLADRLGSEAPDAESILRLVWSQLEDSLRLALDHDHDHDRSR